MSEPDILGPEAWRPNDPYEQLVESIRSKFQDAVIAQHENPGFVFVAMPLGHPVISGESALFALAPDVDDMAERAKDVFHIGVPIGSYDIDMPFITLGNSLDTNTFTLARTKNGRQKELKVDPTIFRVSQSSHRLPLRDFVSLCQTYTPYPVNQRHKY